MINLFSYCSLEALKGKCPTTIRQSMTPSAQVSAFAPTYDYFFTISGDMQAGVPQQLDSIILEFALKPKSIILIFPYSSNRMFQGFKSLWQTPFQWQQEMPYRTCLKSFLHVAELITLYFLISPERLCFPPFYKIKQSFLRSFITSTSLMIRLFSSDFKFLIYLLMHANLVQFKASIFQQVLTAQFLLSQRPMARETTVNAPFPMCDIILQAFKAQASEQTSSKYEAFSAF